MMDDLVNDKNVSKKWNAKMYFLDLLSSPAPLVLEFEVEEVASRQLSIGP